MNGFWWEQRVCLLSFFLSHTLCHVASDISSRNVGKIVWHWQMKQKRFYRKELNETFLMSDWLFSKVIVHIPVHVCLSYISTVHVWKQHWKLEGLDSNETTKTQQNFLLHQNRNKIQCAQQYSTALSPVQFFSCTVERKLEWSYK